MTSDELRNILLTDDGVQSMARLYAALNDWQDNVEQVRRGARTCERIERIRDDGLVPFANEYFRFVASLEDKTFTGDAGELIEGWADYYRFKYVDASEERDFDEYGIGLRRFFVDPECRFAQFAHDAAGSINDATITAYDRDEVTEYIRERFEDLWKDWWYRLDDLYWERRYRLGHQMSVEMSKDRLDTAQAEWDALEEKYPEFPFYVTIGGKEFPDYKQATKR